MRFDSLQETLTRAGFSVHTFPTGQAAKDWLAAQWSGKTIGLGGSMTLEDLGLYEALSQGNTVYWHWRTPGAATLAQAAQAQAHSLQRQRRGGRRGADQHRRHRQPDLRRHRRP